MNYWQLSWIRDKQAYPYQIIIKLTNYNVSINQLCWRFSRVYVNCIDLTPAKINILKNYNIQILVSNDIRLNPQC